MSIHLLGLPTDINSSFLRGPAKAPRLIREALFSDRGNQASELGLELGHDIDLIDEGDLVLAETPADFELISSKVSEIAATGGIPICLGHLAEHAITGDASVVDQDVDRTMFFFGLLESLDSRGPCSYLSHHSRARHASWPDHDLTF